VRQALGNDLLAQGHELPVSLAALSVVEEHGERRFPMLVRLLETPKIEFIDDPVLALRLWLNGTDLSPKR